MRLSEKAMEYKRKIENIYVQTKNPDIDFSAIGLEDSVWHELELAGIVSIRRTITDTITFQPDDNQG